MVYCENGFRTYYEDHGEGEPLVLITGLSGNSHDWMNSFKQPLLEHFRLIYYDPLCAGKSENPEYQISLEDFTRQLLELLQFLKLSNVMIYGVSMGSWIASHFTLEYPEIVKKLILASSAPSVSYISDEGINLLKNAGTGDRLEQTLNFYNFLMGDELFQAQRNLLRGMLESRDKSQIQKPEAYQNQLNAILQSADKIPAYHSITCPVLILKPELDTLVDPKGSEDLHNMIPDSRIIRYPKGIHGVLPNGSDPDMAPIIDFLLE